MTSVLIFTKTKLHWETYLSTMYKKYPDLENRQIFQPHFFRDLDRLIVRKKFLNRCSAIYLDKDSVSDLDAKLIADILPNKITIWFSLSGSKSLKVPTEVKDLAYGKKEEK